MKGLSLMLLLFLSTLSFASGLESSFFSRHREGWFWYQDFEEKDTPNKTPKEKRKIPNSYPSPVMQTPTQRMKAYQQFVEDQLNLAILDPTEQNLQAYAAAYFETIQRAQQFTDAYRLSLLRHPDLDYSLQFPTQPLAQAVYARHQTQRLENTIKTFSRNHGFFFFFDGACPYTQIFAPILKTFSEKYQLTVLAINLGITPLKEFPAAVFDKGVAKAFKVSHLPALFVVNPKTKQVFPIGYGAISLSQLEDNVLRIVTYNEQYPGREFMTAKESKHD